MHNSRGNGSSRYDTQSTSSGSYDRWHDDSEWSSRNETWRGSSDRSPRRSSDHRHRNDSWKEETYRDGFRHGKERAPMPVDDQFLVRYGAKRLPNGNLVDRDGYTLRVRDPDCRAPSPPRHNPGRDTRRADIRSGAARREELNRMSKADIDRKARQQMELVKEMAEKAKEEEERRKNMKKEEDQKDQKEKNGNSEGVVVEEGEDEYEEEEEDDEPAKKKNKTSENGAASTYANNIKKALLMAPRFAKRTLLPAGPQKPSSSSSQAPSVPAPLKAGSPNDKVQKSWFRQYQEHVNELKEKVYRPPSFGPGAPPLPSSTGYFFQSPPPAPPPASSQPAFEPCGPFGGPLPRQKTPSSTSSSPYCSGTPVAYGTPFGEIYSNPTAVPLQMALPPPGVVGFEAPRESGALSGGSGALGAFHTSPGYSEAYTMSSGPSGGFSTFPTSSGASGAFSGQSIQSGAPAPSWTTFGASEPHSGYSGGQMTSSLHGMSASNNKGNYGIIGHHQQQGKGGGGHSSDSDDEEEEDEAILKLREIIRNCGSSAKR